MRGWRRGGADPEPACVSTGNTTVDTKMFQALPGLKLPKTEQLWAEANLYFQINIESLPRIENISEYASDLQKLIYEYFATGFGIVETPGDLSGKYKNWSVSKLKSALRLLKLNQGDMREIRFVSGVIRNRLRNPKRETTTVAKETEDIFQRNFWKACKKTFTRATSPPPMFSLATCASYFSRILAQTGGLHKRFRTPSWVPPVALETKPFDNSPPTYQSVTRAIKRLRSSTSPCPLDQIPALVLKKCPIIRTVLHRLIVQCWLQSEIPTCWKRAMTILIYKKGETTDPANFRPITLQPIMYKVLSAIYRDKIYKFMIDNNYLDRDIQKGFWPGCDGLSEHSELLTHMMREAKRHNRSITITTIDLRNAFGEVDHRLIEASLEEYRIPKSVIQLFANIYNNSGITVAVNSEQTQPVTVNRGVLQGDPCSPLLFNICFNSLMRTICQPKYKHLGYLWGAKDNARERCWLQFADDAIIVSSSDKNAQTLLNVFSAWCGWAGMQIRIDKCQSFGMRKECDVYKQYCPAIFLSDTQIPATAIGESFTYLGKIFNFSMDNEEAKKSVVTKLSGLLESLTNLSTRPQTKLKILKLAVYPRISFELKIYKFTDTWITNSLDSVVHSHVRRWLELPISTCVEEMMTLPNKMCGYNIPTIRAHATNLKMTTRYGLKTSANDDIRQLWHETSTRNVSIDSALVESDSLAPALRAFKLQNKNTAVKHVKSLTLQGAAVTSVIEIVKPSSITIWTKCTQSLPSALFCFVRKGLQQQLATLSNVHRWGKSPTAACPLCNQVQTNKHVLSNCSSPSALQRYKRRHDAVLFILCNWLKSALKNGESIYADIPGFEPLSGLFQSLRPDIAIVRDGVINLCELTVCHETNLRKSRDYKLAKYANIECNLTTGFKAYAVKLNSIELTVLGFISDSSVFTKLMSNQQLLLPELVYTNIIRNVIGNSYNIYLNRNVAS